MADTISQTATVPTGVKILAVFYYIGAVFSVLLAILLLIGASFIDTIAQSIPVLALIGGSLFIVVGIVYLVFGILGLFIGRGLWKGKNLARIFVIIVSIFWFVAAIMMIFNSSLWVSGIVNLLISGLIGCYLLFSKSVKEAFGKK